MPTAYIALGANLADREGQIRSAADFLRATPGVISVKLSPLMEYPAVGGPPDSPDFLNAVAEVQTTLSPRELLQCLLDIERQMGRVRNEKWGPRKIDLDLLLYDDRVIHEPELEVPHPRMHERRFVLEPLARLAPKAVHPVSEQTIGQILAALTST
jgi:2-amino-4-hydroxy-6-hydroxymethyldihydropteridine diphosphokinase